jgi:polysaccharide export outer membrane protein
MQRQEFRPSSRARVGAPGRFARRRASVIAVIALALASGSLGCGDPPPSEYPMQQVYVEDTTLGPGDVFDVRVYRQEEMTGTYSVSSEGSISFPLVGVVKVSGLTPAQVERALRDKLADGFLRDPQVSVLVKEYKSKRLSVIGEVRRPGTLGYAEGMTVVDAIAQAGGFTNMARKNAVTVTRSVDDKKTAYTVPVESIGEGKADNFFIRPGDVVFVPRRLY